MIKRLMKCIREYKRQTILSPIFISLEAVMEVIIPLLMAKIIDIGVNGNNGRGNMNNILLYGGILVVSCVLSLLFGALAGKYAPEASAGFAKNIRHDMYYNIQNFSFRSIDKFSTSSLVTRMTTDTTNVQNSFQMIIRIAVRCPSLLIFSLAAAFSINARLALIFVAVVPFLGAALFLIIKKVHPIFKRVFKTYDRLNGVVQENLHGIRVVKSFVREDFEDKKFDEVSESIYKDFSFAEKVLAFNNPLMQTAVYVTMLLIAWCGAHLIVSSTMTTGELMSLITYTMQILNSLMMISMVFVMITMSRASAERIVEVLEEKSDIVSPENALTAVDNGEIVFDNVNFSYSGNPEKLCLLNVNLKIPSGATVGIIGGTGSSKSTLVSLVPRLYDVTSGSVSVGGHDVREYDLEVLRSSVAMVLQKNVLFSGTIKDNIRWGDENAADEDIERVCRLAQADGFIREFPDGYDTVIDQGGTNVSGGQKQRLCIARALLKKPKILILDDSTSAVDTATDSKIRKAFRQEIPDTTKLIIAQRISSVQDADMIIVLDNGKIDAVGTHEELLRTNDIYREVYTSQMKGGDAE